VRGGPKRQKSSGWVGMIRSVVGAVRSVRDARSVARA
jgi:hypothetical protein